MRISTRPWPPSRRVKFPKRYTADGAGHITLPIALMGALTDAEANASTGDIRQIFLGLSHMMQSAFAAIATADKPNKMRLYKSTSVDDATGKGTQTQTQSYDLAALTVDMDAE